MCARTYTHAHSGPHSCLCVNMKGTRVFWVSSVAFSSIPLRQSLSEPGTLGVCRLVANQQISASPFVSTLSELESYSISMKYEYEYACFMKLVTWKMGSKLWSWWPHKCSQPLSHLLYLLDVLKHRKTNMVFGKQSTDKRKWVGLFLLP